MKTAHALALLSLALLTSACSSKAPVAPPVVQAAPPPWAESRIAHLSSIAAEQGFEIEREGEQIRLIIPVAGNFHPKRTLLLPSGLVPLSKVAQALKDDVDSQYSVIGHSDSSGDADINHQLSMERAQAVASVLMLGGVSRQRMHLRSMGEAQPRADNNTPTGQELNRRVEILLTPYPTRVASAN